MWHYTIENISDHKVKVFILENDKYLSFEDVFLLWRSSDAFIDFYTQMLVEQGHEAFFWEHPSMDKASKHPRYEVVLVYSRLLKQLSPNKSPFEKHFDNQTLVVSFSNIGKDALLVVPCPVAEHLNTYTHLANFVRMSSETQRISFWKSVGSACLAKLGAAKFWLNTAGLGVHWLHVRLDSTPKYYKHIDYKI